MQTNKFIKLNKVEIKLGIVCVMALVLLQVSVRLVVHTVA